MASKISRPFGLWSSSITASSLAAGRRLDGIAWDGDGRTLVWLEGRGGRGVLVAQSLDGEAPRDLTSDLSVRAEVSYGGGDFTVHNGAVYFVVHKTGRIWRQSLKGGPARPLTPRFGKAASPIVSPDGRWAAYVHHDGGQVDRLAVVDAEGAGWPRILAEGHDFFMQPRFSPDGRRFCFVAWDHPNMPWDGTSLYLADVVEEYDGPRLNDVRRIAGGAETAIFQPEFAADGLLLYVSDESGWGRIAAHDLATGERRWLTPDGVEHGTPAWVQDMRTYAVCEKGRTVIAARGEAGFHRLWRIDTATGDSTPISALDDYSDVSHLAAAGDGDRFAVIASGPTIPPRVVVHDAAASTTRVVARAAAETTPADELAQPRAIQWTTGDDETAHGLLYSPVSSRFEGIGKPPLVVLIHGGPTSQARAGWSPNVQYFATRGYAVLSVNYRGSTGYGRPYMLRLRGQWGVADVEDAVSGARHLVEEGVVDRRRTVIMGGSAGGFTVLQTMARHPEAFTAGVSLYGVANQFSLAADTHKFESRYTDSLLGPLPEAAELYRERSPVFHAERIRRPMAIFQGDEDRVVPRGQSDEITAALARNGTPHEYHVYEGEGHGWRKSETIERFYQAVESFLRRHVIYA